MKLFSHFKSIRYKFLICTVLLMLTFMVLTAYLWYWKTSNDAADSSAAYVSEMLRIFNENFEVALRDINYVVSSASVEDENVRNILENSLEGYASDYELLQDTRKIQGYLTSSASYKHYLAGIMASSLSGHCFTIGDMPDFDTATAQDWFKSLPYEKNRSMFIAPHAYNTGTNSGSYRKYEEVFSIVRPIFISGKVNGFILADIKASLLQNIYDINLKGMGTVTVFDTNTDTLIYHSDNSKISVAVSDLSKLAKNFISTQGQLYSQVGSHKMLVLYKYSQLTNWTTIGLIPMDEMLTSYNRILNTIVTILLLFMLAGIIMTYLISGALTRNILLLNNALKTVGKDNMDISIAIRSHDEISQLYRQFNSMAERIRNLVSDIKNTEAKKRKAELKALQSQINPHFMYNTLNTIKFLSMMYGADNIKEVSESLSRLMHINMDDRQFISLGEEIQCIESYMKIQEYKFTGKFEYKIEVDEKLSDFYVLKLLLQPIVENALLHGIAPLNRNGIILIRIYRDGDCMKLRIQDNGAGMDREKIAEISGAAPNKRGIGLTNTMERIKLNFGEDYGIGISSEKGLYTVVELTVPLITEKEVKIYA